MNSAPASSLFAARILRGANVFSQRSVLAGVLRPGDPSRAVGSRSAADIGAILDAIGLAAIPLPHPPATRLVEAICRRIRAALDLWPATVETLPDDEAGFVVPLEPEELIAAAVELAVGIATDSSAGAARFRDQMKGLREAAEAFRPFIQVRAVERACRQRDIPFKRLAWARDLHQIGAGARQSRLSLTVTSTTGKIASWIAGDKAETVRLLARHGVPVPKQIPITRAAEAWPAAQRIGLPVVVKPRFGNKGRGVSVNLRGEREIEHAAELALAIQGGRAVVESYIPGADYRVLVAFGEVLAVAERVAARVVGDGLRSIGELIRIENDTPMRAATTASLLTPIIVDDLTLRKIGEQGYALDSVPPAGETVALKYAANRSLGGTCRDATEAIHPDNAKMLIRAVELIGLDAAGIDFICSDIARPFTATGGAICEVNSRFGILVHMAAEFGTEKSIAARFVEALVAAYDIGRVPVIIIYGSDTAVLANTVEAMLRQAHGRRVGVISGDSVSVDAQMLPVRVDRLSAAYDLVIEEPSVDLIIACAAPEGVIKRGLGLSHADLAVVAPHASAPRGADHPRCLEILRRTGATILESEDASEIVEAALRKS